MKLDVKYTGTEADRGRMNALDLGPAILGVGEMVGQASRILYRDDTRVRVEVHADLKHASFGIEFIAVATQGIGGLTWAQLSAIAAILGFGGKAVKEGAKGVVWLYRWQKNRRIDKAEKVGNDEIQLTINDESVTTTVVEYNIFINPDVRKGFKRLVEPLESDGIDGVTIQPEGEEPLVISREERKVFIDPPLPEEAVAVDRSTAILEIVSPSFREGNKWRFAQGDATFYADILDDEFLAEVAARNESFESGDALRVEMEIETTREGRQLKFERRITRVLEHLKGEGAGDHQLPLV